MPQRLKNPRDISGLRFARLIAIKSVNTGKHPRWEFQCDCGITKIIIKGHVVAGKIRSCGCLASELTAARNHIHGLTKTRCFTTWQRIKERCDNTNNKDYYLYGGRGITYCERWDLFENFFQDMGHPPHGLSIDRIDVNGNYETSNCRWATATEQANNRRNSVFIEYDGQRKTISEWARVSGLKVGTIWQRLKEGCNAEDALRKKYDRRRKQ